MKIKIALAVLFVILFSTLKAQTTDTELWSGGVFQWKLNQEFQIHIEEQLRFNKSISSLELGFTEVGLKYNLNKHFAFKGNYRFIAKPDKYNRNRLTFDTYYKWKKKAFPLSINYRLRFQNTKENTTEKKFTYLRNELTARYDLSKLLDPYISYEIFYQFNKINQFRVTRLYIGLYWRWSKRVNTTTFYCIQKDINIYNPGKKNILGIMFIYKR